MVVVEGEVSNDDFSGGLRLRVKRVMSMEDARTSLAESLRLKVSRDVLKGEQLRNLGELLKRYDRVLVPEMNTGQLKTLLRDQFLVDAKPLNKVSGQPFRIAEIEAAIMGMLQQ